MKKENLPVTDVEFTSLIWFCEICFHLKVCTFQHYMCMYVLRLQVYSYAALKNLRDMVSLVRIAHRGLHISHQVFWEQC